MWLANPIHVLVTFCLKVRGAIIDTVTQFIQHFPFFFIPIFSWVQRSSMSPSMPSWSQCWVSWLDRLRGRSGSNRRQHARWPQCPTGKRHKLNLCWYNWYFYTKTNTFILTRWLLCLDVDPYLYVADDGGLGLLNLDLGRVAGASYAKSNRKLLDMFNMMRKERVWRPSESIKSS